MMTWNLLAIKTCGYHLKCWTQETQSPHTHRHLHPCVWIQIHLRENRSLCSIFSLFSWFVFACNATHIWHWPSQNGGSIVPFPFDRYPQSSNYVQVFFPCSASHNPHETTWIQSSTSNQYPTNPSVDWAVFHWREQKISERFMEILISEGKDIERPGVFHPFLWKSRKKKWKEP